MSTVDNRVVNMQFNNKDFAAKIQSTMVALQKLDESLQLHRGAAGLQNISKSVDGVSFANMEAGIESVKNRFSTMGIIGMTAIQNLTNGVINFAKSLGSKAIRGGITRSMNLEKADFMLKGIVGNGEEVKAIMKDVNKSVDGTAYSLDQAALVAAQFAATGMRSGKEMRTILKGVTGISAVFSADYQRVGQIYTQISAQNRVFANDLNSLSSLGVNAKAAFVKYFTEVEKKANVTTDTVDEMVKKGQIDFKTFGNAMAYSFGDQAKEANRTFTGALSNVNAALSRLGEGFITPFVKTKEMGDKFYNLVDVLNMFREVINGVTTKLKDFGIIDNKLDSGKVISGKFTKAVQSASKALTTFLILLEGDIAGDTGKALQNKLDMFQEAIGMSDADFKNLKDTFSGVFSIFKIFGNLIESFVKAIFPMGDSLKNVGSGFLAITGAIGRYITNLEQGIKESGVFTKIFSGVSFVVGNAAKAISYLAGKIKGLFSGLGNGNAGLLSGFVSALDFIAEKVKPLGGIIEKSFGGIRQVIDGIFDGLGKALKGADFDKIYSFLSLGVSGGIGFTFVQFLNNLNTSFDRFMDLLTGKALSAGTGFQQLVITLQSGLSEISKSVRADTIMKIAKAIAILAGSVFLLSIIEPGRLLTSLAALQALLYDMGKIIIQINNMSANIKLNAASNMAFLAGSFTAIASGLLIMSAAVKVLSTMSLGELVKGLGAIFALLVGMDVFMKDASGLKGRNMTKIAKSLIPMSVGLFILSQAVKQLASLKLEDLAKGIIGIGILLVELAAFMNLTKGIKVKGAVGIIGLSAALLIIANVVKQIGSLKPEKLAKGLVGLGFILLELAGFIKLVSGSKGILKASIGMLALAEAMKALTSSLQVMGNFSEEQLAKGLLSLGASLVIIAGAMRLMPPNMVTASAGLFIAAQAIKEIAAAMSSMGGMKETEMAKSLVEMAGALGILAIAMKAMSSSLAGAAAMVVVSAALSLLAPVLVTLGSMSLEQIVNSLVALAGALVIFGVAGAVLGPMAGAITLLAGAIALFGIGLLSAGAGMMLFVGALKLLGDSVASIITALPILIDAIIKMAPQVGFAGAAIIFSLLKGIASNIGNIISAAIGIVTGFIDGVSSRIGDIIDSGMNLAISFIDGIANGIDEHGGELRAAIGHLLGSIIKFVIETLQGLLEKIPGVGKEISKKLDSLKDGVDNLFGDGKATKNAEKEMKGTTNAIDKETKKSGKVAGKNFNEVPKSASRASKKTKTSFNGVSNSIDKELAKVTKGSSFFKGLPKMGEKGAKDLTDSFKKNVKKSDGEDAGNKIKEGVKSVSYGPAATNGYNGFSSVWLSKNWYGLGAKAADEKNRGFKEHDKQHSPSRLWAEFAQNDYLGYYNNMKHLLSRFAAAGGMMADAVHKPFEASMHKLNFNLNSIDSTPTIRPVLDLSNVKMGLNSIDSMFNQNQYALRVAGSLASGGITNPRSMRPINVNANFTINDANDGAQIADDFIQELEVYERTYNG